MAMKRAMHEVGRMVRETGQALDRVGLRTLEKPIFKEAFSRHRAVMNLYEYHPDVANDSFVAPNASVVGNVFLGPGTSVWYGAVVRGDLNKVLVGRNSSIGDRVVIHTSKSVEGKPDAIVKIGEHVRIEAGALLQSCTVEDRAIVGAGAVIMEGAVVEEFAHVAEGAVVHPGRRVPKGQLWAGNPAVFVRNLTKTEMAQHEVQSEDVHELATEHASEFLPYTTAYQQAESLGVSDASLNAMHSEQAAKDAGVATETPLTPTQVEVESMISPAPGLHPPKGKSYFGVAEHRS